MSSFVTSTIQTASALRLRSNEENVAKPTPAPIPTQHRKEMVAQREKTQDEIDDAVQQWYDATMATAAELATRFNKKPRYFLDIFFSGGARMVNHQEKVNAHNAFISMKAQELREEGRILSLTQIQEEFRDEYNALDDEDREKLAKEHKENIDHMKKLKRPAPRGRVQDFANISRNIMLLMTGLKARIGVEGFFCLVRNNTDFKVKPMWHWTSPALRDYMQIAVGNKWSIHNVGLKLEAFSVAGCDPLKMLNTSKKRADYLKHEIRDMISANLVEITGNPKATMQYTRYEDEIVLRYGVVLEGWTYESFVNPSELSSSLAPLTILRDALKSGACKFVKLSAAEKSKREAAYLAQVANGQIQPFKRKRRSDVGVARKKAKRVQANSDGGSDDGDGATEKQKGRSKSVVDTDDDGDE